MKEDWFIFGHLCGICEEEETSQKDQVISGNKKVHMLGCCTRQLCISQAETHNRIPHLFGNRSDIQELMKNGNKVTCHRNSDNLSTLHLFHGHMVPYLRNTDQLSNPGVFCAATTFTVHLIQWLNHSCGKRIEDSAWFSHIFKNDKYGNIHLADMGSKKRYLKTSPLKK